jgi:hypothetical protein
VMRGRRASAAPRACFPQSSRRKVPDLRVARAFEQTPVSSRTAGRHSGAAAQRARRGCDGDHAAGGGLPDLRPPHRPAEQFQPRGCEALVNWQEFTTEGGFRLGPRTVFASQVSRRRGSVLVADGKEGPSVAPGRQTRGANLAARCASSVRLALSDDRPLDCNAHRAIALGLIAGDAG